MTDISLRELDEQKMCLHLTVFGHSKPITLQVSQPMVRAYNTQCTLSQVILMIH